MDKNRENGGLVFQPFLDFRVEIFTEDGHFLAISVFIIVTGLKPQNKKQFGQGFIGNFGRNSLICPKNSWTNIGNVSIP